MRDNTMTFTDYLTANDIIISAHCADYECGIDYGSDPNLPMCEFKNEILKSVYESMFEYYNMFNSTNAKIRAEFAVLEVKCLLDDIVIDALMSGTWMSLEQLWNLQAYKIVNMANAVRK